MRWRSRDLLRLLTSFVRPRQLKGSVNFWPIVLFAMVVLLTIIAALQYRWTAEATGAHEFRVGSELEARMIRWHLDLYREFSAICVALQVGPDSGAHDNWTDYLQRYVKWSRGEQDKSSWINLYSNPDLIDGIYIWETSRKTPRLLRFNPQKESIEPSSEKPELNLLLSHLRANSANLALALHAWRSRNLVVDSRQEDIDGIADADTMRSGVTTGWQFDESVPLIVHPIVRRDDRTPVDWIIIVLNREVIQSRTLPELVKRHFGGPEGLDFRVAVVSVGKASRVIYASEPGFGTQDPAAYDSVMNLFGPPPESVEAQVWQTLKDSRWLQSEEWRSFSSPVWLPTIEYGSPQNSWILVVQSQHGPLQAVVQRAKFRNLAISALVLLLLAANMGVATIAGARAQRFADLQMNFVASVSHELRTPLSVLHTAAENIKDGLVREKTGMARYGTLMISQTRQLMSHVDRIMLFASIRSGKARYTMRPVQVPDIIRRAVIDTEELVKEHQCTVLYEIEPNLPCVRGDMYAIRSCVENLVTNAIKYSDKDRHVRISAASVYKDGVEEVWISVQDSGIGISNSEMAKIFQPFYRSPEAVAAQIHGTGLGLFVAKHIAEAMGGRLSVTSEVGVGTTFTLQLSASDNGEDPITPSVDRDHEETPNAREHSIDRG